MRLVTTVALLPLILVSGRSAAAETITLSPDQIGQIFCISSLGNDMAPVEALLSADLAAIVADAWLKNAAFEAASPGDKPPLGDGLPWRTWPDYADGCTVTDGDVTPEAATALINYSFAGAADANYINTLRLTPATLADGVTLAWRIDDIDLGEGRTMRSLLAEAFAP